MKKKSQIALVLLLIMQITIGITIDQDKVSTDSISFYFTEIKANASYNKDLWNIDIYGPILLVDPNSRRVYANYPDSAGFLKRDGDIYSGILPKAINTANTAIKWSGRSWAMIMLPLPANKLERLDLLSHELFHRSQPLLGFKMSNPANSHLDLKDGRIYLQLELEALRQALISKSKPEADRNLTNALCFRKLRYTLYPEAKSGENLLELNEGLAEYTGIVMSRRNEGQIEEYLQNRIIGFKNNPTFVRSFAYLTVPLYGTFLSRSDKYWNRLINNNTNLTDLFIKSFNLKIPDKLDVKTMNQYGFSNLNTIENEREERIKQVSAEYKARFIELPHLEIRFVKMSISFDPRNIMPLEGYGTVYPNLRVSDVWGILTVSSGALLGTNWDKVSVSEPTLISREKAAGDGWTIDLNPGFIVQKNTSGKNYSLIKH